MFNLKPSQKKKKKKEVKINTVFFLKWKMKTWGLSSHVISVVLEYGLMMAVVSSIWKAPFCLLFKGRWSDSNIVCLIPFCGEISSSSMATSPLQSSGMLSREQLLYLFNSFSQLTSQPGNSKSPPFLFFFLHCNYKFTIFI